MKDRGVYHCVVLRSSGGQSVPSTKVMLSRINIDSVNLNHVLESVDFGNLFSEPMSGRLADEKFCSCGFHGVRFHGLASGAKERCIQPFILGLKTLKDKKRRGGVCVLHISFVEYEVEFMWKFEISIMVVLLNDYLSRVQPQGCLRDRAVFIRHEEVDSDARISSWCFDVLVCFAQRMRKFRTVVVFRRSFAINWIFCR